MAIRPVVLVYQDFATQTVTPATPDLNCLAVGPAYFIQDYFVPGSTAYADKFQPSDYISPGQNDRGGEVQRRPGRRRLLPLPVAPTSRQERMWVTVPKERWR